MNNTNLVFIVGSGRCGTKTIAKMLAGIPEIEAHHEYCRYHYQREAILYAINRLGRELVVPRLLSIYESAAYYSESPIFLDSSHKLVWVIDILQDIFPNAKFVHLIRDGHKVVSSFYYKLNLHNDNAAKIFRDWISKPGLLPLPPPSEQYWMSPHVHKGDRFERICWHWRDTNSKILEATHESNKIVVRLEDMVDNSGEVKRVAEFIGIKYDNSFWRFLQKPDHVYVPIDYKLTDEQRRKFAEICTPLMNHFGYNINEKEYDVKY